MPRRLRSLLLLAALGAPLVAGCPGTADNHTGTSTGTGARVDGGASSGPTDAGGSTGGSTGS
jgi:hypothetical protein